MILPAHPAPEPAMWDPRWLFAALKTSCRVGAIHRTEGYVSPWVAPRSTRPVSARHCTFWDDAASFCDSCSIFSPPGCHLPSAIPHFKIGDPESASLCLRDMLRIATFSGFFESWGSWIFDRSC